MLFPFYTFSDNKGRPIWVDLTIAPPFPLQVAAGLVNDSRHQDSAHHLTVIRTKSCLMKVEPEHSIAATHFDVLQKLNIPPTNF